MTKIFIDPGHGGKDPGAVSNGLQEKDLNLTIGLELGKILKANGIEVLFSRTTDVFIELSTRAKMANTAKVDGFISIHANATGNSQANGLETFHFPNSVEGKKLATSIQNKVLVENIFKTDRGVKTANFAVLRQTAMPAALVELGFVTNAQDARLLKTKTKEMAQAVANGIFDYLGFSKPTPTPIVGLKIESKTNATVEQMRTWAKSKKAHEKFIELAQEFFDISNKVGVNPLVAYVQSAKETGFMKFGGVIDITYNNPCGLKTTAGGDNYAPSAHKKFKNWTEGIQAQVDHLALYAGITGYPKANTPDPRHFPHIRGTAPTVESLGGKWAPSLTYGNSIVAGVKEIENTPQPVNPNTNKIVMNLLGTRVSVKGIVKDQVNYLEIDKAYIPVRSIFETMGLTVEWDYGKSEVVIR